jgi:hypothetical protein
MPSYQRLKCHNNSKKSGKSESTRHNKSVGIFAFELNRCAVVVFSSYFFLATPKVNTCRKAPSRDSW